MLIYNRECVLTHLLKIQSRTKSDFLSCLPGTLAYVKVFFGDSTAGRLHLVVGVAPFYLCYVRFGKFGLLNCSMSDYGVRSGFSFVQFDPRRS